MTDEQLDQYLEAIQQRLREMCAKVEVLFEGQPDE